MFDSQVCRQIQTMGSILVPRHGLQGNCSGHILHLHVFILMAAVDGIRRVAYATALYRTPARCDKGVTSLRLLHILHTRLDHLARNSRLRGYWCAALRSRSHSQSRVGTVATV